MTDIDIQFNLRRRHPCARYQLLLNIGESLVAQLLLKCSLDVRYGESAGQMLDIFPAKKTARAPVVLFIHGGYFRALDKSQYRYIALPLTRSGYTTVLINYDLAPRVRVSEIIRQVLVAFEWVRNNIHRWGGDPDQLILCGHSVGAFLAAKILEKDWPDGGGIRKAALLSGLYDLGPMKRSYLNRDLRLSDADVEDLSPQRKSLAQAPEILISVGEAESEEFVSQSKAYGHRLSDSTIGNELLVLPGINHYSMSRLLGRRGNPVMDWITAASS